jgi:hypothetical protein
MFLAIIRLPGDFLTAKALLIPKPCTLKKSPSKIIVGTNVPAVSCEKLSSEGMMWLAITSVVFGAAIGLNVFALWLADRFGQLQKRG